MPSGWNKDFAKIFELFTLAERKIKYVEHISSLLKTPSINELRYAGKHVLDALKEEEGSDHYQRAIIEAEIHCHRAIYDAMEVGIMHCWRAIKLFSQDYRTVIITDILPDYSERIAEVNAIIEEIGATEDRNSPKERLDKHEQIQQQFNRVQQIARIFEAARDDLNKLKARQEKEAHRQESQDARRAREEDRRVVEVQEKVKEGKLRPLWAVWLILAIIVIVLGLIFLPPWRQDGSQGQTPKLPEKMQPAETDTTDFSTSVDTTIQ